MKIRQGETEEEVTGDLVEINSQLFKKEFDSFEVEYFDRVVNVDLVNQKIILDGNEVGLDLGDSLSDIRWIHIKRNTVSYRMAGLVNYTFSYGVGFQGNKDGLNVQRIVLIDDNSIYLEKKDNGERTLENLTPFEFNAQIEEVLNETS